MWINKRNEPQKYIIKLCTHVTLTTYCDDSGMIRVLANEENTFDYHVCLIAWTEEAEP